jgi:hypothetical protein
MAVAFATRQLAWYSGHELRRVHACSGTLMDVSPDYETGMCETSKQFYGIHAQ